jgi:hypothetical protein
VGLSIACGHGGESYIARLRNGSDCLEGAAHLVEHDLDRLTTGMLPA